MIAPQPQRVALVLTALAASLCRSSIIVIAFRDEASLVRVIAPQPQRIVLVLAARWRQPFRRSSIIVIVFRDEGIAGTSDRAAAAACCTSVGGVLAAALPSFVYHIHFFTTKASLVRVTAPQPPLVALVLAAPWRLPFRRSSIILIVFRDKAIASTSDCAATATCCTGAGGPLAAVIPSLIYHNHCVSRRRHRWYERLRRSRIVLHWCWRRDGGCRFVTHLS